MNFELSPISPANDAAVAQIIRTVMTECGLTAKGFAIHDPQVESMAAAYEGERSRYWVVKREGRVVGGGGFAPLEKGPPLVCELQKMYFLPEARGTGAAEKLLHLCLREAAKLGFTHSYLETAPQLNRAKALYEKNGFLPLPGPMGDTGHFGCTNWYLRDLSLP